jgi:streptomycin 6-kinase
MITKKAEGIEGQQLLQWRAGIAALYDSDNKPLWFEHPTYGHAVDVVALAVC